MDQKIEVQQIGIASALNKFKLRVPPNQREYSWSDVEVKEFLQDIFNAMRRNADYFLGTVVLTRTSDGVYEVADGQQRLATTSIVLATLRNLWREDGDEERARLVESEYLWKLEARTTETLPRLTLNLDDNGYFRSVVLRKGDSQEIEGKPQRYSHRLISDALNVARDHFEGQRKTIGDKASFYAGYLVDWLEYLEKKAQVVMFSVPNSESAFKMFETLNDRGLKTSQADLVKNYLFSIAGDRRPEAHNHWSAIRGSIDSTNKPDDLTMDFLRLVCSVLYGHTRAQDVFGRVQDKNRTQTEAISLLNKLKELSVDYAAILNPDHPKWGEYDENVRRAIRTIKEIGVSQLNPLMLAVARRFSAKDTAVVFRNLVAWSVRFLIEGERGSKLDEGYAKLANKVYLQEIKSAAELQKEVSNGFIPTDATFEATFQNARVSKSTLARYYLRSLETEAGEQPFPELLPNDNSLVVTLEHIMPKEINENWPHVTQQDIETHCNRIGNLTLLAVDKNSRLGNEPFEKKRIVYDESALQLTSQIAQYETWGTAEIEKRQKVLAQLAVRAWPLR